MHRRVALALPKEWRDTSRWPRLPDAAIAEEWRETYERRVRAVEAYVAGARLKHIFQDERVDASALYGFFDACCERDADGNIRGFVALAPYAHRSGYRRNEGEQADQLARGRGTAGLFAEMIRKHPTLGEHIEACARAYVGDEWLERRIPVGTEHAAFLRKVAKITGEEGYPFSVTNQGREGFRQALHAAIARARGKRDGEFQPSVTRQFTSLHSERFRRIQLDAHRLDKPIPIKFEGRKGRYRIRLMRPWLLAAIDADSTASLGWHVTLAEEISELDVLLCLYNIMNPWSAREQFEITELAYEPEGGMPSGLIEACRCRFADSIYADNALAFHANNLRNVIHTKLHAALHLGRAGTPETRSEIEQLFNTLTHANVQRLVGAVWPDMSHDERKKAHKDAAKFGITLSQIEEYLDVIICARNGRGNGAHYNKTPLDYLAEEPGTALRRCDASAQAPWRQLLQIEMVLPVRTSAGHPPHVNYLGGQYSSDLLRMAADLVGKTILVTFNLTDLSSAQACTTEGAKLGPLAALREWGTFAHDIRLRKILNRALNDGRFQWSRTESPEETVARFLRRAAQSASAKQPRQSSSAAPRRSGAEVRAATPREPQREIADIAKGAALDLDAVLGDKLRG